MTTVNLSYFAGAGWQFFDDNGIPLAGGKIYAYEAGTTTPVVTYTSSAGAVANPYPVVLDSAGRPPSEVWVVPGALYKFVVKTSADVTIRTYDNIGVVTDSSGILPALAASSGSSLVGYIQGGTNSDATTVQAKLRESVSVLDFGADPTGVADSTSAVTNAIAAVGAGKLFFPAGTYKGNFVINKNVRIVGAGREETIFIAQSTASPIVHFTSDNSSEYYYIGGEDFTVDGESTAATGVQIGLTASPLTGSVTYGAMQRVNIKNCDRNLYVKDTVGFIFEDIYCVSATNENLYIGTNDIATALTFTNCQFRLGTYGARLLGGAILKFNTCVFENNTLQGVQYIRESDSGVREALFDTCWFEGNGTGGAPTASSIYIDMSSTLASGTGYASLLQFDNCNITSDASAYNVYLNRGDEIYFNYCTFDALTAAKLHYESGPSYAYALLRQCSEVNYRANPSSTGGYANFPALTSSPSGQLQGFRYEYFYRGYPFSNGFKHCFSWQVESGVSDILDITGNGAVYKTSDLASASASSMLFDRGGYFNSATGTFTAPYNGEFQFKVVWPITNFSSAMSAAQVFFIVTHSGSPTTYSVSYKKIASYGASDLETYEGDILLNLEVGDTVVAAIAVTGGAGNTARLYRGASLFTLSGTAI